MCEKNAVLAMTISYNDTTIQLSISDAAFQESIAQMVAQLRSMLNDEVALVEQIDRQLLQPLQAQNALAKPDKPLHPEQVWFDHQIDCFKRGDTCLLHLTPTESNLLRFFIENPYKQHTLSDLCAAGWPETHIDGVTTECLYQMISGLRRKIEVDPKQAKYVVNWRGAPEGGYRFYPTGNAQVN